MPTIEVVGGGTFQVEEGKKLVLALEDNGVDILHRCGGNAKCTTCRVEVIEGDFGPIHEEEEKILLIKGHTEGTIRLSCQVHVKSDAKVSPLMTVSNSELDAGPRPSE
jgi:ferredoxin